MLPGKQNKKNTQSKTQPAPSGQQGELSQPVPTLSPGVLEQGLRNPRQSRPDVLLHLQRSAGNRAVNRLLTSPLAGAHTPVLPVVGPSISRVSRMTIQRELSEGGFSVKATEYGYADLAPNLLSGLVAIINAVIRKYPQHEQTITENLGDLIIGIHPEWPVTAHTQSFLQTLAGILRDAGVENFEAPEGIWDIGRAQPPTPQHDEGADGDNEAEVPEDEGEIDPEELAARQGLPQELGVAQHDIVPVHQRLTARLTMGQGLVANLGQLILYSEEFSSCSPIVMFNAQSHLGGLFHFPAGRLEDQAGNLTNMYQRVNPTNILLNDRGRLDGGVGAVLRSNDHNVLEDFFVSDLGFQGMVEMIPLLSNQYALTLAPDQQHIIIEADVHSVGGVRDVYHDDTGEGRRQVGQDWQAAPAATKFGRDDWHN